MRNFVTNMFVALSIWAVIEYTIDAVDDMIDEITDVDWSIVIKNPELISILDFSFSLRFSTMNILIFDLLYILLYEK